MMKAATLKKKLLPYVLVVCIALLIEIFGFNFRSYESLFYDEKLMGEFESYVENDEKAGISSLFINTRREKIHNVYLNMGYVDKQSGQTESGSTVVAAKETGVSTFKTVADTVVSPGRPASHYVFLKTKGNAEQIRIDFPLRETKSLRLYEVKLNAHRPLFFSWLRFSLLIIAGVLCFIVGKVFVIMKDKAQKVDEPSN